MDDSVTETHKGTALHNKTGPRRAYSKQRKKREKMQDLTTGNCSDIITVTDNALAWY